MQLRTFWSQLATKLPDVSVYRHSLVSIPRWRSGPVPDETSSPVSCDTSSASPRQSNLNKRRADHGRRMPWPDVPGPGCESDKRYCTSMRQGRTKGRRRGLSNLYLYLYLTVKTICIKKNDQKKADATKLYKKDAETGSLRLVVC